MSIKPLLARDTIDVPNTPGIDAIAKLKLRSNKMGDFEVTVLCRAQASDNPALVNWKFLQIPMQLPLGNLEIPIDETDAGPALVVQLHAGIPNEVKSSSTIFDVYGSW